MLWLDLKYTKLAGSRGTLFRIKRDTPFLATQRCPICGDSKTNSRKTRFYFLQMDDSIVVKCHNCDYSGSILKFLKAEFIDLYNEYVFERFKSKESDSTPVITSVSKTPIELPQTEGLDLPSVWQLKDSHPAKQYVMSRKLPKSFNFLYCDQFNKFSSQFNKEFANAKNDHPRIIIEYKTAKGKLFAYQGRAINGETPKYQTVVLPSYENYPKIFGLNKLDLSEKIYLVEGPIDSLFINNCIASTNASLSTTASKLLKSINTIPKENLTLVIDNEPRNTQILEQYKRAIESGFNVVIWPKHIKQKDINDMVLSGLKPKDIIDKNTFSGLTALNEFTHWKMN